MLDWREISKRKDKFLEKREAILRKRVTAMERQLFLTILDEFVSKVDVDEFGFIITEGQNIDLVDAMDELLNDFMNSDHRKVISSFVKDLGGVSTFNERYFRSIVPVADIVKKRAKNKSLKMLGITPGGNLKKGGYLERILRGSDIINEVKKLSYSAVQGGLQKSEMRAALEELITTTDTAGAFQKYYRTFVYDTYSQFDRTETSEYAKELGMPVARYAGGRVKDSRPFCLARENKYILVDEIKKFGTSKDDYKEYARDEIANGGYENHKRGEFQGKNKGYVAQRDLGGHNCIHRLNYVTAEIAIKRDNSLEMRDGKLVRK